jgi:hypothetical protein
MAFEDLLEEDFVEIQQETVKPSAELLMRCVQLGKHKRERVQFTFTSKLFGELNGQRFNIAYAAQKRIFRIKVDTSGKYEPIKAPRGLRFMLRCPVPFGFHFVAGKAEEPEYYVDAIGKVMLVETPQAFCTPVRNCMEKPAGVSSFEPGPPSGQQDPDLAATLGLTRVFPRKIGDAKLTEAEASVLEVLYRRPRASRDALMMATAKDAAEDDRDDKIVDIYIHKLRKKLGSIGIEIQTVQGAGFQLTNGAKDFLSHIVERAN